jgi:parallel beta-helix repeat protein
MIASVRVTYAQNSTWHVATYGSDITGDGSETNPFATIQHAIDMAGNGDTILVAQGTYSENISVIQKNGIHIQGAGADVTTIDGGGSGHVVVFNVASGSISGFTISNSGNNPGYSAGVFTSQANVSIEDNIITNNHHGITASSNSDVIIQGNQVISNTALSAIKIMTSSTGVIFHNVVASNTWWGIYGTPSMLVNNTIVGNGSFGVLLTPSELVIVRNNIIVGNRYGVFVLGREESAVPLVKISYNDVWNNSSADYWEEYGTVEFDLQPNDIISRPFDPQPGTGEIHTSPLFVDADNGNHHLQPMSPCIDAGDPNDDYSNEPEPSGMRINMGAYGNTAEASRTFGNMVYLPIILR